MKKLTTLTLTFDDADREGALRAQGLIERLAPKMNGGTSPQPEEMLCLWSQLYSHLMTCTAATVEQITATE